MFLGKSEQQLSNIVKELQDVGIKIGDQGNPAMSVSTYKSMLNLSYTKHRTYSSFCPKPLHAFKDSPFFGNHFNYCLVAGKINYIVQKMQPDIICAVRQCSHFSADPCIMEKCQVFAEDSSFLNLLLTKLKI